MFVVAGIQSLKSRKIIDLNTHYHEQMLDE